jgi:hypothetical protein
VRLEAARLWRLIGRDAQWCRVRRGQAGCRTGADAVAKRFRRAIAMLTRTCGMPGEVIRANVRPWVALPQRQHWTGRSGNRDAHV